MAATSFEARQCVAQALEVPGGARRSGYCSDDVSVTVRTLTRTLTMAQHGALTLITTPHAPETPPWSWDGGSRLHYTLRRVRSGMASRVHGSC